MAQDCRAAVLLIEKFVHEDMDRGAERIQGKIADIFRECEQGERGAERQVCECGLRETVSDGTLRDLYSGVLHPRLSRGQT